MNFLPYRKYTFNTSLSENEVRNRLNCLTRAANAFRVKYYPNIKTSDYEGTIYEHAFFINRLISYRNSFLPSIEGKTTPNTAGTTIFVKMKLNIISIVFGCLWFGALTLFSLMTLFSGHASLGNLAIPGMMMILGAALFSIPFAIEADIAKKDLARIFECEPLAN